MFGCTGECIQNYHCNVSPHIGPEGVQGTKGEAGVDGVPGAPGPTGPQGQPGQPGWSNPGFDVSPLSKESIPQ